MDNEENKYDEYYNYSDGDRICTPGALVRSREFQDADLDGKSAIAGEYLSDLKRLTLKEFSDNPKQGLEYWKKEAQSLWNEVSPSWGERAVDFAAGAARSIAYGAIETLESAAHGAASLGLAVQTAPMRAVEEITGLNIGAQKLYNNFQKEIDSALPAGAVFNEKAGQHLRYWSRQPDVREISPEEFSNSQSRSKFSKNGKFYRNFASDHEDDVQNLLDAAAEFSAIRTPENFEKLKSAELAALKSGANFNSEDFESYKNRSFLSNEETKSLLEYYVETGSPDVRAALNNIYGKSDADLRSDAVIQAIQKRAIDRLGDNFFGRERAIMLEYADPSEAASTVVEGVLTAGAGKLVHGAVAGAKTAGKGASILSKSERLNRVGKAAGAIAANSAFEAGTEIYQTKVENPFATDKQIEEAAIGAIGQSLLLGGIGVGTGAITGRRRVVAPETPAEADSTGGVLEPSTPTPPTSPQPLGYESAPVLEIPVDKLKLSKDVPNFKEGASTDTGVVEGQELKGSYERVGTAPIVVWERSNGDLEVITGRHRLDLARRTGEKTIPSYLVRESDGFTAEDARTFDAESNIRDENGSVRDYAHYFRNKDMTIQDAESKGLLSRKKGRDGWDIGKSAADELYTLYRNNKISADRAAAISRGAPNDAEVQRAVLASSEGMDATTLEIHARRLAAYKNEHSSSVLGDEPVQGDLFGENDSAIQEMVAISKAAGELVKENRQKILAVKGVVKRPEVAREMGVDINDPDAVKAAIEQLENENRRLTSPTPDIETLNKIRRKAGLPELQHTNASADVQRQAYSIAKQKENNQRKAFAAKKTADTPDTAESNARDGDNFRAELDEFKSGRLPTHKILKLGMPSEKLINQGIPNKPITIRQSVIKKIIEKHGLGYDLIANLPEAINDPVAIFSYPQNKNVRDILLELRDKKGRAIIASLELNVSTQRYGEVSDLATVHPKENIGRIYDWIRKGRLLYLDKQKGRKFLQDSAPANWEQYGTELSPLIQKSEKISESQGEILENFGKNEAQDSSDVREYKNPDYREDVPTEETSSPSESAAPSTPEAIAADYETLKAKTERKRLLHPALFSRTISKSRALLPESVKWNRELNRIEGTPSIGDIRRYAEKTLSIPISKKLDMSNARGIYYTRLQAIRTRGGYHNDFDVLAHELGHYLENVLFGEEITGSGTAMESELRLYCYEKFKNAYPANLMPSEGWAQFVSDLLNDVNDAKYKCPVSFGVLEKALLDNPNVAGVLENIRQMAELNRNANAWDRARANIKRESQRDKTPLMEKIKEIPRLWRRRLFDRYEAIDKLAKIVDEQGGDGKKLYQMVENYSGGHIGQSEYSLLHEQLDLDGNVIGPGLRKIYNDNLKTAFDRENIDSYLVAARAKEYFAKKTQKERDATCRQKFGLSYEDVEAICSTASVAMKKCAEQVYQYQRNDLKMGLDSGLLSHDEYNQLLNNNAYVPLRRFMEFLNPEAYSAGTGNGLANANSPLKGFKGSDREIIDVFYSIAENSKKWREAAAKNRISKNIIQAINKSEGLGNWASHYPEKISRTRLTLEQWANAILDSGLWGQTERNPQAKKLTGKQRKSAIYKIVQELKKSPEIKCYIYEKEAIADAKEQVITFWNNGERTAWQIHDKGLYEALAGMDGLASKFFDTIIGKILSMPAKLIRATATNALNFTGANFVRDNLLAGATSNNGFVPFASSIRWGLLPAIQGNFGKKNGFLRALNSEAAKAYDEWVANGGRFSTQIEAAGGISIGEMTSDAVRKEETLSAEFGDWLKQLKNAPFSTTGKTIIKPFELFSKLSEEATRVAEFRLSREKSIKSEQKQKHLTRAQAESSAWAGNTRNRMKAANDSKRVTLNFARGGTWAQDINQVVPFFNATMQAIDKIYSELLPADFPKLLNTLYSVNSQTPRETISGLKKSLKKDNAVKLLKVLAIASIAGVLERAFSSPQTDDLPDWRKLRYWNFDIGGTVVSVPKSQEIAMFSEIIERALNTWQSGELDARPGEYLSDTGELILPQIIPQFIKPFLENYMNYSFFRNAPIENAFQRKQLPSTRRNVTTSQTAIWLAEKAAGLGIEISPIMIDNLNQNLFSSLGRDFVRNVSDPIINRTSNTPPAPEKRLSDYPFTGAFFPNMLSAGECVSKFYNSLNECEQMLDAARRISQGKISNREFTDRQRRIGMWYTGCPHGSTVPRYKELRNAQKLMSEINNVMQQIRMSYDLSPKQKRALLENCVKDKNAIAKKTYEKLAFSEEKFKQWAEN